MDHYVDPATDREEVNAAAVWVHAGGKPWNSPEASELFLHVGCWLEAVTALLHGETSASIWAWEENDMQAIRQGDLMTLEERTHHVQFQLPPVRFVLRRFAEALRDATRGGAQMERELMRLAAERYPDEWRAIVPAVERSKVGLPLATAPADPVMDEFGRRLWTAIGRDLLRLGKEIEREQEMRREADPEGFARQKRADHLRTVLQTLHGGEMSAAWEKLNSTLQSVP